MIDLKKRNKIMSRSIKLGHCICDPRQKCPCALFKEKNVCHCAGEHLEEKTVETQLTRLVENAGCASKISQEYLKKILSGLPEISDPKILVGTGTCDDAGVYRLNDETALVQSVDVFTPNVDDPYTFGQIAAANSVSDIYAMGGVPLTALSIIAFPSDKLNHKIMIQMLLGGLDKMKESNVAVIGGHSIKDREVKFGFAVTGIINPLKIVTNSGLKPGDNLVLTKPIGVGVISFAHQLNRAVSTSIADIGKSMAELNKIPSETMVETGVSACTDLTGFGLLGHLGEMVSQSGVTVRLNVNDVPVFNGVLDCLREGIVSGAIERNKEYVSRYLEREGDIPEEMEYLLCDPQTSGGLLIGVPEEKTELFLGRLNEKGVRCASVIGKVACRSEGKIILSNKQSGEKDSRFSFGRKDEKREMEKKVSCCGNENLKECCPPPGNGHGIAGGHNAESAFAGFMEAAGNSGSISLRNKELMAIALSLISRCEPCLKLHLEKAIKMGIGEDEINEAVWLAVSFGGAPVRMFYSSVTGKE